VAPLRRKVASRCISLVVRASRVGSQPPVASETCDLAAPNRIGRMFEMDEDIQEEVRVFRCRLRCLPVSLTKILFERRVGRNSSRNPQSSPLPRIMCAFTRRILKYRTRRPRTRPPMQDKGRPPLRIRQRRPVPLEHLGEVKEVARGRE